MAFQVPASKAVPGKDTFDFAIAGETFKVRKVKFVPIDTLDEVETSTAALLDFFSGTSKEQSKAVRALDREQFSALVTGWREDSEVTAGNRKPPRADPPAQGGRRVRPDRTRTAAGLARHRGTLVA